MVSYMGRNTWFVFVKSKHLVICNCKMFLVGEECFSILSCATLVRVVEESVIIIIDNYIPDICKSCPAPNVGP